MMPLLRPRVGKQKMHNVDRLRREQIFHCIGRFDQEHAHVAQVSAGRFPAGAADATDESLDPEKIPLRMTCSERGRESAFAVPVLEHERVRPRQKPTDIVAR